jgi:ATP-dependent DNA ligase
MGWSSLRSSKTTQVGAKALFAQVAQPVTQFQQAHRATRLALHARQRHAAAMLSAPGFIEPCLPTINRTVPTGAGWAYEIKHDGFRFICRRDGERVRLFSRGGHDWSKQAGRNLRLG